MNSSISASHNDLLTDGYAALERGIVDRAEILFRLAVQHYPDSSVAWRALAETQSGARRAICLQWAAQADAHRALAQPRYTPGPRRPGRRSSIIGASLFGAIALFAVGSDLGYHDRILPGVSIGPLAMGSQPIAAARATLEQHQRQLAARTLRITIGAQSWNLSYGSLLDDEAADVLDAAASYGHEASFWQRLANRAASSAGRSPSFAWPLVDRAAIRRQIDAIATAVDSPAIDAQIVRGGQGWQIVAERAGHAIDRAAAVDQIARLILASSDQTAIDSSVELRLRTVAPPRTAAQLTTARDRLDALARQPLTLTSGDQRWTLDRSMLVTVDPNQPERLIPSAISIDRQIAEVAAAIDRAPQPSVLERAGDRIRRFELGQAGVALDRVAAAQQINDALLAGTAEVALPVSTVAPAPGEAERLGLIGELGRGDSQFATYSSPDRDANVVAGGNDIDGVLVAPGNVFSFTETVGSITWQKGYRWGEAIEAGTVVPSLGGGICQVSTTVFRAAFWSGMEIVERHNHAWRLPWYEVDAPVGMDATIALGGPDLRFRNTTQHAILIKVTTDIVNKRQHVVIYGTPDGRTISMEPLAGNTGIRRHVIQGETASSEDFVSWYSQ